MTQITDSDREERNSLLKLIDCMGDDNDCWRIDQAFARHRIQALSTQAAELDALRGEMERLKKVEIRSLNYEIMLKRDDFNTLEEALTTIAQLRDRLNFRSSYSILTRSCDISITATCLQHYRRRLVHFANLQRTL